VLLDKLIYEVDKAFIVLGGDTGPLTPSVTYEHILPHRKGSFERALAPPFVIGPNAVGSFNVVVRSDEKGAGQTWLMRIALHDTGGDTVSTEEFQLIMSKRGF
jgi:hypothetical protein